MGLLFISGSIAKDITQKLSELPTTISFRFFLYFLSTSCKPFHPCGIDNGEPPRHSAVFYPRFIKRVTVNAKTQRPGVCNAAETLLVHRDIAEEFLPRAAKELGERGVELRGCKTSRKLVPDMKEAAEEDWYAEYLDLILAVRVVESLEEAVEHINTYSSAHTDAIVTSDIGCADYFVTNVDSSSVMVNASTRFSDGGVYGLGAEIGISTDKLHARGPMGVADLTTYKWVVYGHGAIRE